MINLQVAFPEKQADGREILRYRIFNPDGISRAIEGNPSVEQLVAKILLTDPNTDLFTPSAGAGMRKIATRPVTAQSLNTRKSEIMLAVLRCQEQIISSQAGWDLPPSEKLSELEIVALDYSSNSLTWTVDLEVHMEDGNVERVLLGV